MRVRWRGFELPARVVCDRQSATGSYGKFVAEPFERGYGHTVGTSLRRVLLSSLEGAAVIWLRVENVPHQFTAIPGCREDVTEIVLNLKQLLVRMEVDEPQVLRIEKSAPGVVRAGDIRAPQGVEIVNPELHLCELVDSIEFKADICVQWGRGYRTAEELAAAAGEQPVGTIPIDASFSPVRRVRYLTENARVGQRTDYDRLTLEIWTNGTVTPEKALAEASMILRKHLNPFVKYFELGKELPRPEAGARPQIEAPEEVRKRELKDRLAQPVSALDLSARAANCLQSEGIETLENLVTRTETDLLKVKNFGKTSLKEIKKKLKDLGLDLGITVE